MMMEFLLYFFIDPSTGNIVHDAYLGDRMSLKRGKLQLYFPVWTEFQNILLKEKSMVEFHLCVYTYTHICICIPNWLSVQKISRRITKKSLIVFSLGDWGWYHYLYFSPSFLLSSWNVLPRACITLLFIEEKND